jgi:hypothetical protein
MRAGCGKSARPVRGGGERSAPPYSTVDHPVLRRQVVQECCERLLIGKWQTLPMEYEMLMLKGVLQTFHKLVAKDRAEHLDGQEEIRWR